MNKSSFGFHLQNFLNWIHNGFLIYLQISGKVDILIFGDDMSIINEGLERKMYLCNSAY